jgi:hypothetical protein
MKTGRSIDCDKPAKQYKFQAMDDIHSYFVCFLSCNFFIWVQTIFYYHIRSRWISKHVRYARLPIHACSIFVGCDHINYDSSHLFLLHWFWIGKIPPMSSDISKINIVSIYWEKPYWCTPLHISVPLWDCSLNQRGNTFCSI